MDFQNEIQRVRYTKLKKLISLRVIMGDCWRHRGHIRSDGRGEIKINHKQQKVHRLSAMIFLNYDINSKLPICHKNECRFKDCWNPDHLYVGTNSSNQRDSVIKGTQKEIRKTHCPKGHLYNEENTYITSTGSRQCNTCRRISNNFHNAARAVFT
jgi:hypothetical protein